MKPRELLDFEVNGFPFLKIVQFIEAISEREHNKSAHYYNDDWRCDKCCADAILTGLRLPIPYED